MSMSRPLAHVTICILLATFLLAGCGGSSIAVNPASPSATTTSTPLAVPFGDASTATSTGGSGGSGGSGGGSGGGNPPPSTPTTPAGSGCNSGSSHADGGSNLFTHVVTAANISGRLTFLDNTLLNCAANAIMVVTPNWTAGSHVYDNSTVGVIYLSGRWAIMNESQILPMKVGMAFNVKVAQGGSGYATTTATASTLSGDNVGFSNPNTDGNPNAMVIVTQNNGSSDAAATNLTTALGVYYYNNGWRIFREDHAPMPLGVSFNVILASFVHEAFTSTDIQDFTLLVESPALATQSNRIVFVTPNWSYASNSVYDSIPTGVFYDTYASTPQWAIFHEDDHTAIPNTMCFNVLILT